ncbi:MAG: EAL domain-containing protein [Nitrospiraceae bacterium]|nr:EAL domain-containing protein [Nitrospiraceae bacterium]
MRRKIIIFLLSVCVLFACGSVAAIVLITRTTNELGRLVQLHQIKGFRQNLIVDLQSAQADLYTVNTPLSPELDHIVQNIRRVEEASQRCFSCHHTPDVLKSIERIQSLISDYENSLSAYITTTADKAMLEQLKIDAAAKGNKLLGLVEEMSYTAGVKLEKKTAASLAMAGNVKMILYITIGLTFLIGLFTAAHLSKSITGPMDKLVTATRNIAAGELGYRISHEERDEFGELAAHFNSMSSALQEGYNNIRSEVAAHRAAEDALSRSERFLTTIFDSIRDPFCIIDRGFTIVRCNESYAEMKGKAVDALQTEICFKVLGSGEAVCPGCIVSKTFSSGNPSAKEKSFFGPDGSLLWAEIYTYPIFDADDKVSHVVEYTRDITERKRTEHALRESKERYELAARGANDGLWDWDLKTDRIYYSPRWKAMLGWTDADIGDAPQAWLDRVHSDDREQVQAQIAAHINGHTSHLEIEHRMLHRDTTYRWMLSRGLAVRDDSGSAYRFAGSQTDITERKRAEAQLQYDAFHDALTGLPNRALFMDRLHQEIKSSQRHRDYRYAVLFIDLDRFKVINDSLGHVIGDKLLIEVAHRVSKCIRPDDTVARLGGDEFAILLKDLVDSSQAGQIAERVLRELDVSFLIKGHEIYTSASIGIAVKEEGHLKPEHIIRDADIAMYHAKALGKACYVEFDASMHEKTVERLRLETDLRQALEQGQFLMHYQPIVNLEDNRIIGFEALIRWNHPGRGMIYPLDFIPIAEETGLIYPIGEWLLRESCRQMREWHGRFPADPPLKLSVNISGRQLSHPHFVETVTAILKETAFDPRSLALEITEGMVIENVEGAISFMKQLQDAGVEFHIDDFGTGYSSLSYLHYFPVNALKIDRSFVSRIAAADDNLQIIKTILSLAQSLNLEVIAEGLELIEQLAHFKDLNCRYGQGFLFSRPMPAGAVDALFKG